MLKFTFSFFINLMILQLRGHFKIDNMKIGFVAFLKEKKNLLSIVISLLANVYERNLKLMQNSNSAYPKRVQFRFNAQSLWTKIRGVLITAV